MVHQVELYVVAERQSNIGFSMLLLQNVLKAELSAAVASLQAYLQLVLCKAGGNIIACRSGKKPSWLDQELPSPWPMRGITLMMGHTTGVNPTQRLNLHFYHIFRWMQQVVSMHAFNTSIHFPSFRPKLTKVDTQHHHYTA